MQFFPYDQAGYCIQLFTSTWTRQEITSEAKKQNLNSTIRDKTNFTKNAPESENKNINTTSTTCQNFKDGLLKKLWITKAI